MDRFQGAAWSASAILAAWPGASVSSTDTPVTARDTFTAASTLASGSAASRTSASTGAANTAGTPAAAAASVSKTGCLKGGNGYLRAHIRGSFNLDLDWHNAEMECDGGVRPDGSAVRVSFAGPVHSDGRRIRMVFGVGGAKEGIAGRELPTNLTVMFEGDERLFATRDANHCTVDKLEQERIGPLAGPKRSYRIVASGFCFAPVTTLDGKDHILVNSFDFAGSATFEDEEP